MGDVDAALEIDKIEWKIKHIVPEDRLKLKLFGRINKSGNNAKIKVAYRMWDLYELPALRQTSSDVWAIKTARSLERPRYIIIGFQNIAQSGDKTKNITQFIHASIANVRLYLNSEVFPYERWNLDFTKKLNSPAYYAYENFQRSYYDRDMGEPMMDLGQFRQNPLFVIDCSHQPDAVKSSTVDVKLEFETRDKTFPAQTRVYALVLHDAYLTYSALDGSVQCGLE